MKSIFIAMLIISCTFIVRARDIVPFDIEPNTNLPQVEVYINGDSVPFRFIVDTGCSAIFANSNNRRLVNLLNLSESDTVEYAHSSAIIRKTQFDNSLQLGTLTIDSVQIFVDDDPSAEYDGIIGQSLFERFSKVGMFPDSKILIFCEKGESLRITDGVILPLDRTAGVYGTNLSIKTDTGDLEGIFMLDTGFAGILNVNSDFSENHKLSNILTPIANNSLTDGAGEKDNTIMVTAPRIIFANESMPLLPISLNVKSHQQEWNKTFNGVIGYDLLKRFRMIWDYENMTITLAPSFEYFSPVTSVNHQ